MARNARAGGGLATLGLHRRAPFSQPGTDRDPPYLRLRVDAHGSFALSEPPSGEGFLMLWFR